jgi:hypothetical protein
LLSGVLLCRQRSYFSFIPPRFGHVLVLDQAFRCLLTITNSMLVPDRKLNQETVVSYYGKALQSLQSAVNDPKARYSTEVLCTTAILALFEVMATTSRAPNFVFSATYQIIAAELAKRTTMKSAYFWGSSSSASQGPIKICFRV